MSQHGADDNRLPNSARNITVNGVSLYVEEHGAGRPVVLVHGGTISSAWWAPLIERLAPRYRVIVFDSRGHGRSTNPTGELSYELIADDTAALIAELGLERRRSGRAGASNAESGSRREPHRRGRDARFQRG
jgi:pimeloyl-ACP methyl ester carboxylesterase